MIDAVIILTLVQEMEFIDVFLIPVFDIGTVSKNALAYDCLVMSTVILLTLVEEME